jgi:hypothetical protein
MAKLAIADSDIASSCIVDGRPPGLPRTCTEDARMVVATGILSRIFGVMRSLLIAILLILSLAAGAVATEFQLVNVAPNDQTKMRAVLDQAAKRLERLLEVQLPPPPQSDSYPRALDGQLSRQPCQPVAA